MAQQLAFDMDARQAPDINDCLYAAGFFDGEGCVSLGNYDNGAKKGKKIVRAQLILGNTNLLVLEWLRDRWGGKIYRKRDTIERRPQWQWFLSERHMGAFLDDVLPFLKVKTPAASNAQAFIRLKLARRKYSRISPEERAQFLPFLKAHQALELDLRPNVLKRRKSA